MNNKYNSLYLHSKSVSTDSSFLVKTTYSTKSSSSNLLDFHKIPPSPVIPSKPPTVTTSYHKRHFSRQYNSVLPSPRLITPNLTPAQRKLHEQGNPYSLNLNYSNSLGYINRLDVAKQTKSVLYNDKIINKHNEIVIRAKEEESKQYRNVSKDKKMKNLYSDIFNYLLYSSNVSKQKKKCNDDSGECRRKNTVIKPKCRKVINENAVKSRQNHSPYEQIRPSRLAMEVDKKYSDHHAKRKKYLNLASSMDDYSLFAPERISVMSYNIKTPNAHNDEVLIKKMFANGGIHIYDVQDNTMGLHKRDSSYNLKVRVDSDNKISQRQLDMIKRKFLSNGAVMKKNKAIW